MLGKCLIVLLIAVLMVTMVSCRIVGHGGEDFLYRAWKHIELYILKFYKDLVKIHAEIDRYVFDLDWEDPDNY
jgi:hypothetical protein